MVYQTVGSHRTARAYHTVQTRSPVTMTNEDTNRTSDQHPELTEQTVYHTTFDPEEDAVSEEVVAAVATLTDADPGDLAVLADVIDPDALDALFQSRPDGIPRATDGRVFFSTTTILFASKLTGRSRFIIPTSNGCEL